MAPHKTNGQLHTNAGATQLYGATRFPQQNKGLFHQLLSQPSLIAVPAHGGSKPFLRRARSAASARAVTQRIGLGMDSGHVAMDAFGRFEQLEAWRSRWSMRLKEVEGANGSVCYMFEFTQA